MEIKQLKTAVKIFERFHNDAGEINSAHDEISIDGPTPDKLTDKECEELDDAGWFYNDEYGDCWTHFT